jgi:hypothetical protein
MGTRLAITLFLGLLLGSGVAMAREGAVDMVGCPSDGQMGPQPAPSMSVTRGVTTDEKLTAQLSFYYTETFRNGVLAPKGWHCLQLIGSNGETLLVTPQAIDAKTIFDSGWHGIVGDGVQISTSLGGTSGRFEVAHIASRIFPQAQKFVARVASEGFEPASEFAKGAWPRDRVTRLRPDIVEYWTAPHSQGLGTASRLAPNNQPIRGVSILVGTDEPDLFHLAVRLPPEQESLAPLIVRQTERDYAPGVYP